MAQKGIIKNSTAADVGAPELASIFLGIIGASGIVKAYSDLACTKVSDNAVQLAAGLYNLSGYLVEVAKGTTVNLAIDSGTAGQNRNDTIAAEFVRNGGGAGIDTLAFVVVKGTSTSGTPADPTLTQQDINGAGVTRQEALWRVKIVGTTLTTIERVANVLSNLDYSAPIGEVKIWPVAVAPTKHLLCDGAAISRTTFADLFTVLGTTYGAGDASTTFNLPNLKGKMPVGLDSTQTEFDALAETGGAKTHTLTEAEIPSHAHTLKGYQPGAINDNYIGIANRDISAPKTVTNDASNGIQAAGGGGAHNNLQPYIVMNYVIRALA